jgi:hypothetical protein
MISTQERRSLLELRAFTEKLIESNMLDLRRVMEQPKHIMLNIITGNDTHFGNLDPESLAFAKSQQLQNLLSSIRSKMEKHINDVRLYEQVLRVVDNLLDGKYKRTSDVTVVKEVNPENGDTE